MSERTNANLNRSVKRTRRSGAVDEQGTKRKRDLLFMVIVLAVAAISIWLLLMPFIPSVARVTLKRFHLSTGSFSQWSIQAPIPAMYNFGNQYEVRDMPEKIIPPVIVSTRPRYINHFPTRVLTSAIGRHAFLRHGQDRWLTMWSVYRGQRLETRIHARPDGGGRFQWVRETSEFVDHSKVELWEDWLIDELPREKP